MTGGRASIPALDGIRGLAALMVALSHMGNIGHFIEIRGTGQHGVMLFFVLSGFLMSWLYGNGQTGYSNWVGYGIRRIMRVYPLYLVVVMLAFLAHQLGLTFIYGNVDGNLLVDLALLRADYLIFWTIPVEMKFYLAFPVIAVVGGFFATGWNRVLFYTAILALMLMIYEVPDRTSLLRGVAFFGFGMLAGTLHHALRAQFGEAAWLRRAANAGLLAGLAGLVLTLPPMSAVTGWVNPMWYAPVIFGGLYGGLVLSAAHAGRLFSSLFANPVARFLGHISFAVYLIHLPVLNTVRHFGFTGVTAFVLDMIGIALLATLFHYLVEKPSRQLARRLSS
jgi:peptidoglycan/LPS O-acetylase OafA/YrhL